MELRPYQYQAVEQIRQGFRGGQKKGLLWLATGGGKTVVFSHMMIEAVQKRKRCLMVVRGRKLVDQASKRLFREAVTHGVLMSGHWNYRPTAPIQVCSIDTLMARGLRPKADLIVIDEAHMAVSDGYKEFLQDYPDAYIVAVTATPYSQKSLRHIADFMVHPVKVSELIEQGFLVPPRYFAPSDPNLSDVKVSRQTGDYVVEQLAQAMNKSAITGDIIEHWKRIGDSRPTLCFAVNIAHSKNLADQFREAGIPAVHCDADTPEQVREESIKKLESGEIKVICNVGIFCTGVDIPALGCLILARPTKSYNLFIQQIGRGTRPNPGKQDFIVLDHAGNVIRHGFITDEPDPDLDGTKKEPSAKGPKPKTCKQCFAITVSFPCPLCQWEPPAQDRSEGIKLDYVPGELKEIKSRGPTPLEIYEADQFCFKELFACKSNNRNPWLAYYKTRDRFGEDAARFVFFKLCKRMHISLKKKETTTTEESTDGYPYK